MIDRLDGLPLQAGGFEKKAGLKGLAIGNEGGRFLVV
jgi:hypothetical protein